MTQETLKVTIERTGQSRTAFDVPAYDNQTVLDVVSREQQNADPTLSYRFACRVGMCGSCAMMVNGVPRWTCRTHISKVLEGNGVTIGPLRNLPVIKDLAVDMDPFFDKWVAAEGVHHGALTRDDPIAPVDAATPARVEANAGIECINCSVCYAACDTVAGNPDYLGPAALQRAWPLLISEIFRAPLIWQRSLRRSARSLSHVGKSSACMSMTSRARRCGGRVWVSDTKPMSR